MIEEYMKSSNRLEYFNNLDFNQRIQLLKQFPKNEKKKILSYLSFNNIIDILRAFSDDWDNRKEILEGLSREQLTAIYRNLTLSEQKQLGKDLEQIQLSYNIDIDKLQSNINNSTDQIKNSFGRIEEAKDNIRNNNASIKQARKDIKNVKIKIKRARKERNRLLKKIQRANKPSKIAIINKLKTRRLKQLMEKYDEKQQTISELRQENLNLHQEKRELEEVIRKEEQAIVDNQERIRKEQINIRKSMRMIDGKRVAIRKLNKTEKKLFGRKLYRKVINYREDKLMDISKKAVGKIDSPKAEQKEEQVQGEKQQQVSQTPKVSEEPVKQESEVNSNSSEGTGDESANNNAEEETNKEEEDKSQTQTSSSPSDATEVVDEEEKKNVSDSVMNLNDMFKILLSSGVSLRPDVDVKDATSGKLLDSPVANVNVQQLITLLYAIQILQNVYQKGIEQSQNQEKESSGPSRRGFVSFATIMFVLAGIISIISIIMLLIK